MSSKAFRELLEFQAPSSVEREGNGAVVLKHVKLLGNRSKNLNPDGTHNVYPLSSREGSKALYEGVRIYVDHPERSNPGKPRSVREQIGRARNVTVDGEGTWADVHLHPKHPLTESVAWSAEHSPDDLGFSHNAVGLHRVTGKDCLVEQITRVRSVDLVCNAATTKGLFEGLDEELPVSKLSLFVAAISGLNPTQEATLLEGCDEAALTALLADTALSPEDRVQQALAMIAMANMPEPEAATPPTDPNAEPGVGEGEDQEGVHPEGKGPGSNLIESLRGEVAALKAARALDETRARRNELLAGLPKGAQTKELVEMVHGAADDKFAKDLIEHTRRLTYHQSPKSSGGSGYTAPKTPSPINSTDDLVDLL